MFRKFHGFTVSLVLVFATAPVMAGGPPWLSLPVEGVVAEKADTCAQMVATKLQNKIWKPADSNDAVHLKQRGKQWNLMFYLGEDVALSDIDAALKGSGVSIARDKLRLFDHVILEINIGSSASKAMLAELDALKLVAIKSTKTDGERLLVTLDMPYPTRFRRPELEPLELAAFEVSNAAADKSATSNTGIKAQMLPAYKTISDVVTKQGGELKDIRWSVHFACRPLGGVATPDSLRTAQAVRPTSASSKDR